MCFIDLFILISGNPWPQIDILEFMLNIIILPNVSLYLVSSKPLRITTVSFKIMSFGDMCS